MPMIDRVHFENFKSLQDVTLHLGRLTALVGPNGCGKSSVLQGMHLLSLTGVKSPTDRAAGEPWGRFASIYGDPSFDPTLHSHRLTSHPNDAATDAERVLSRLCNGDPDREHTGLARGVLHQRGADNWADRKSVV